MGLTEKNCVACTGATPPLSREELTRLLPQVPSWELAPDGRHLKKRLVFQHFLAAMAFVDRLAALAEAEQHHPDFTVRYNTVDIELTTHAIGGLSENDLILAAKIDVLSR